MGLFSKNKKVKTPANTEQHKQASPPIGPEYFKDIANKCANEFSELDLDYSIESLSRLDEFIDKAWTKERFKGAVLGDLKQIF